MNMKIVLFMGFKSLNSRTRRKCGMFSLWSNSQFVFSQVSANGNVLRSEIVGAIKKRVYLSGMPELRLGLNDKVLFESTGRKFAALACIMLPVFSATMSLGAIFYTVMSHYKMVDFLQNMHNRYPISHPTKVASIECLDILMPLTIAMKFTFNCRFLQPVFHPCQFPV